MRQPFSTQLAGLVRLARLPFMAGGFVVHGLGVALALSAGQAIEASVLVLGQATITAAQLMNAISNDYFDLPADRVNETYTRWSGGSRALPQGLVSPRLALRAALVLLAISMLAGAGLAGLPETGPWTLPLVLVGVTWSWFYSAPPIHLHRRGLGEVGGALLMAVFTPLLGTYIHAGRLDPRLLPVTVPFLFWQIAMLIAVSVPDAAADAAVGKRTLFVRLGGRGAARVYVVSLALGYLALAAWPLAGLPAWVTLIALVNLPVALHHGRRMWRGDWADRNYHPSLTFWSIHQLMGSMAAVVLALLALAFVG